MPVFVQLTGAPPPVEPVPGKSTTPPSHVLPLSALVWTLKYVEPTTAGHLAASVVPERETLTESGAMGGDVDVPAGADSTRTVWP